MPPERTARPPSGTRRHVTTTPFSPATNGYISYNARDIFVAISPIVALHHLQPHDSQDIIVSHNASIPPTNGSASGSSPRVGERENRLRKLTRNIRRRDSLAAPHLHAGSGLEDASSAATSRVRRSMESRCPKRRRRNAGPSVEMPGIRILRCRHAAHLAAAIILAATANDLFALAGMARRTTARVSMRRVSSGRDWRCCPRVFA